MALTTHILDLTYGTPAENVLVELYLRKDQSFQRELVHASYTNLEGLLLLRDEEVQAADYELLFYIGDYFRKKNPELKEPVFLDVIPVRFMINDTSENYHIPLQVSPFGYQVYRETR